MDRIVVVISGGVVRTVLANNPECEVEVIDFDNAEDNFDKENELREQLANAELELQSVY